MKMTSLAIAALSVGFAATLAAQNPPPAQPQAAAAQPPAPAGQRQGGGGGGGRGRAIQTLSLSTTAWVDGAMIPVKYTQAGEEVSPPLTWTAVVDPPPAPPAPPAQPAAAAPAGGGRGAQTPPPPVKSYVLIVHDIDAPTADLASDTLHWMVWNIPATAKGLPEHVPQGPELADGSRQIAVTGPYYRGPAAPATGPQHHYVFDLYALDTLLDVPSVNVPLAPTRAAVTAAMAGHIRGKATLVGRFKYGK